ncbi:MAG: GIY-YIG nuclease family protein [Tenuifilaceae bacterium]|jgi:putative endonuclease|nr:GIY-YIG nuclease family protein [Tenuifilaceae bacterium]
MCYFTYILESELNGRYYVGSCEDVAARLKRHNEGATPSTKPYRPWRVVWTQQLDSRAEALKREREIKRMKSRLYIERLIAGGELPQ